MASDSTPPWTRPATVRFGVVKQPRLCGRGHTQYTYLLLCSFKVEGYEHPISAHPTGIQLICNHIAPYLYRPPGGTPARLILQCPIHAIFLLQAFERCLIRSGSANCASNLAIRIELFILEKPDATTSEIIVRHRGQKGLAERLWHSYRDSAE